MRSETLPREMHVAVIIPTYNRAALVTGAIESVLGQTYAKCYVLVIDDASTDDTARVIADRYGSNHRVQYVRQPSNGGVARARNVGIARVNGGLLAFLDSDDRWVPWKLELQVACLRHLQTAGVGMIWTDMDSVDSIGRLVRPRTMRLNYAAYRRFAFDELFPNTERLSVLAPEVTDPGDGTRVHWGEVFSRMLLGNLCQPSTVVLTRERAHAAGGFDENMRCGEDYGYHLRCARAGPAALVDIAAVQYRQGAADQLTHTHLRVLDAESQLRTLEPIARCPNLPVPAAVWRSRLAEAYAWAAQENLDRDDSARARLLSGRSLAYEPLQPRMWAVWLSTLTGARGRSRLRRAYRHLKRLRG